ncbi:ABC transporter substrate-binding protein [Allofranklinella schreckenbergeri]|uniref:ABC transporter substrate-binding protein n=2 Tax=Allofranklinella schreckenbergeri TaxID=1076744 RepID=A0A3M6QFW4_9BURK|nr:ABC transporter substrate-binding protein [Allofranklinella schreckenbergeri]
MDDRLLFCPGGAGESLLAAAGLPAFFKRAFTRDQRDAPTVHHRAWRALARGGALAAVLACALGAGIAQGEPSHAYALWGQPKYPAGFAHFDYANPAAPKGGELRLVSNLRTSTFDKYNPFTLRGSAPAYLQAMLFESLLTGALDETSTGYGLLAESVDVAADRLSATFRIRAQARFHNGKPVLAEDVRHSFETLISAQAAPGYATLLEKVARAEVLDARTVRFHFKSPDRELPLVVGGLPIFSRDWGLDANGQRKPFDQIITDTPIGSGPYRIGPVVFGRDITYVRDPDYWGRELAVNAGAHNFERITIRIYKDATARLEALKAGEFDLMQFHSAGDWARRVKGRRFDSGELVKAEFEHRNPTGFQSYFLNLRRPHLQDVRVRRALALAMDYEWMNRRLFYGSYRRVRGLFGNTQCAAEGLPSAAELALLEPWRSQIPPEAFGPMPEPPRTDHSEHGLRENLRQARELLAQAGWTLQGGTLRNAQGQPLVLEVMDSNEAGIRTVAPWQRNLQKIGIELRFRVVDFALMLQRMDAFDYDITSLNIQGTHNPGQEYAQLFGSFAADQNGSANYSGLKSPAVDALIARMVQAGTQADYQAACRALERVVTAENIMVPAWYASNFRVVYNAQRLAFQAPMPPYVQVMENWAMAYWWATPPSPTP